MLGLLARLVAMVAAALTLIAGSLAAGPLAAPAGAAPERETVWPLVWTRDVADPSVVEYYGGYLVTGTGPLMPRLTARGARGPWRELPPTMTTFPSWVLPGDQWAPALHQVADGSWVVYYSALVGGLNPGARCLGVATAATATGPFTPSGDVPLVCPPRPGALPAEDQLLNRASDLPFAGAIDGSVFEERDGRLYLLYKTQGTPSSIRMVPLTPDGLHVVPGKQSRMLLRSNGIVENPTLVHHGSHYVLFTSEGWYGDCDYRTTWRKTRQKFRWPTRSTNLLGPVITGLCGPGGADVVVPRQGGRERIFFHAWVCHQSRTACPRGFRRDTDRARLPVRGLYAGTLDWGPSEAPQVAAYLTPR